MKNYIATGATITITAPLALTSGQGVLVDSLFGIACSDIASGAQGDINTAGVYDLTKQASQAWTVGAKIYWNNTTRVCTNVATGNSLIGVAIRAVGGTAAETTGRVRLNGVSVTAG